MNRDTKNLLQKIGIAIGIAAIIYAVYLILNALKIL
jgi:hypothetical protein